RAAADAAVRGIALADVSAFVQHRRRTRAVARAADVDSRAWRALPLRRCRAARHDHSLHTRRAPRPALDDRTVVRPPAVPLRVARVRCGVLGRGDAMGDGGGGALRDLLAGRSGAPVVGSDWRYGFSIFAIVIVSPFRSPETFASRPANAVRSF